MLKNNLKLRKYYQLNKLNTTLLCSNSLYLYVNLFFFDKYNRINLSKFLKDNNISCISLLALKNNKLFNLINNLHFFKNINYCLKINNFNSVNKQFLNILTTFALNNENIDFIYLKYPNYKSLISINFLLNFYKNNKSKNIQILLLKLLFIRKKNLIYLLKNKN